MKKLLFTLSVFAGLTSLHAQTPNHYLFKAETQAYAELANDTAITPAKFGTGDMWAFQLAGNNFSFFGKNYAIDDVTRYISFSNSGHMRIDDDSTIIIIDGLFYYMDSIDNNSELSYKVDGTGNNKILKVQWKNLKVQSGPAGNFVNFQMWIYQATGIFEIRYGTSSANNQSGYTNSSGPNIGMFYSKTDFSKMYEKIWITGDPTNYQIDSARNLSFNGIHGIPANGTVYRFIPKTVALNSNTISKENTEIHIYPNPADNRFKILVPSSLEPVHIELTDITGKIVLSGKKDVSNGTITVETKELAPGAYILSVRNSSMNYTETLNIR